LYLKLEQQQQKSDVSAIPVSLYYIGKHSQNKT
jgi:hypothetical protein